MNALKRRHLRAVAQKTARLEKWPTEGSLMFAQLNNIQFKQEKTAKKTERDLRFLKRFFKTYDEDRII